MFLLSSNCLNVQEVRADSYTQILQDPHIASANCRLQRNEEMHIFQTAKNVCLYYYKVNFAFKLFSYVWYIQALKGLKPAHGCLFFVQQLFVKHFEGL